MYQENLFQSRSKEDPAFSFRDGGAYFAYGLFLSTFLKLQYVALLKNSIQSLLDIESNVTLKNVAFVKMIVC